MLFIRGVFYIQHKGFNFIHPDIFHSHPKVLFFLTVIIDVKEF